MSTHILYLDVLVLASSIWPSGLTGAITPAGDASEGRTPLRDHTMLIYLGVVALIDVLAYSFLPSERAIRTGAAVFYAFGVIAVPLTVLGEMMISRVLARLRHQLTSRVNWRRGWKDPISGGVLSVVVFAAMGEEFIFRQVWLSVLIRRFGFMAPVAIVLAAIVFGLNHMHLGHRVVLAKMFSGCVYGALYVFSGFSLLVPTTTHVLGNCAIVAWQDLNG